MPKTTGGDRKSETFKNDTAVDFEKPKSTALHDMGITQKQAERFQMLAAHPDIVAHPEGRQLRRTLQTDISIQKSAPGDESDALLIS